MRFVGSPCWRLCFISLPLQELPSESECAALSSLEQSQMPLYAFCIGLPWPQSTEEVMIQSVSKNVSEIRVAAQDSYLWLPQWERRCFKSEENVFNGNIFAVSSKEWPL